MNVKVKKLHRDAIIPKRQTELASGFDLYVLDACNLRFLDSPYDIQFYEYFLKPGERALIRTGIAVQMPEGLEAQVRPRSGLSLKKGLHVALGTIDADYTGDIGVIVMNLSKELIKIPKGERIAQLVFAPVFHNIKLDEVDDLNVTERGEGGFGSTGTSK
ncbi:dUTP diphosphatase [Fredinandcohnia humi]